MAGNIEPSSINQQPGARKLENSLAVGFAWTALARWSVQLLSWASSLVVMRLLSPSDLGLMGMATLLCGLLQVVTDAFGSTVVSIRNLTEEQLAQLNSLAVISGILGCLIACGLAFPIGRFFESPQLPWVVLVLSSTFLISGFQTVPYGLLYKEMQFKLLSVFVAVQGAFQALVTLALAILGFRFWALVVGNLLGVALLATLQISRRPCRFAKPRFSSLREALTFNRHIMVSSVSWYGYSNADFLVAGRVLGQSALGFYTVAWNLATIPLEKVTAIVSNVAYPHLSAEQGDLGALRRYLRILTEALSVVIFPVTIGMALVAGEFVPLLLGTRWSGTVAPLQILACYVSFRSLVALLPPVLNVTGESRFVMRTTQAALILMPTAFYCGSKWGPQGIAYAWLFAYPVVALLLFSRVFRRIEMPWRQYLAAIWPALGASLVMTVVVETVKYSLKSAAPARLAAEVLAGGAAYVLTLVGSQRHRLSSVWSFLRQLRGQV